MIFHFCDVECSHANFSHQDPLFHLLLLEIIGITQKKETNKSLDRPPKGGWNQKVSRVTRR